MRIPHHSPCSPSPPRCSADHRRAPPAPTRLVTAAPGARNLAANGGYQAWAAPAAGGRWRLTVRAPDGSVTTPAIADFGAPPRPQIGSTQFAASGRRLLAVYSRCQGASATAGCDVYAYDLAAGTEQKIPQLASKSYSETAPSIELGRLAFVRRGGGPKPGVYYWALGSSKAPKRLSTTLARETATNSTRVAYTYNSSRGGGAGRPPALRPRQRRSSRSRASPSSRAARC